MFPQLLLVLFLGGAMRGFSAPYVNLYLDELQFSATLIGVGLSVASLVELVVIPFLSNRSDRTGTHRRLFRGLILGYVFALAAMLALPLVWILFIGLIITQVSFRSTYLFAMQLAFTRLEQHGKSAFGRVRSVSSGGFTVGNLLTSLIFTLGGYVAIFSAAIVCGLAAVGLSNAMPASTSDKPTKNETSEDVQQRKRQLYPVFAAQFFAMMGLRTGFAFWLLHFQDHLGISTAQISIIVTLSAVMELPFFLLMDRPLRKYSAAWFYIAGVAGLGVQWLLVGIAPNFWWVLVVVILRGPAFAAWNLAILVYINQISHPRNVSTNQALAQITIPSIASLLASAPLGYVYDHFPPLVFFSICCGLMLFGAGILLVSQLSQTRRTT